MAGSGAVFTISLLLVSLGLGCAARAPAAKPPQLATFAPEKLLDLGHPFDGDTVYWPTESVGFQLKTLHHGPTEGGYFYASNSFAAPEHGGTHLDAPIHFAEGKATTDRVPLSRLMAPAVVIDISERARQDRDTLLNVADIEAFERAHGSIARGTIVLIRSDWSTHWPNKLAYLGSDVPGDASNLHFPGISAEAARALVARNVAAVGIDTASIDHGPSHEFWAHRILMGADIPAFENLTELAKLPARGALVIALPMYIRDGSGGPLRAVAVLP
ncbi:MAG: cyclase family protein [Myxococcales bacterium]